MGWRERLVPTGTVTLLAAEVEDSSRPREAEPDQMSVVALLDDAVWGIVTAHHGVRRADGGERDSFVAAFTRASDALACAVNLQRMALPAPIRLRIGLHTGEVQLLDDGNYLGPTMSRTARLRDLAHGGQIVLSGTTHDVAADRLPADVWLMDLGRHRLPDLPRPERVVQVVSPRPSQRVSAPSNTECLR